jgi:hypothetical protein
MEAFLLPYPTEIEIMAAPKIATSKDASFYVALISLAATVLGIPIMFLTWIEPHLENDQKNQIRIEVGNQLTDPLAKMSETNTHLAKIEASLEDLKPFTTMSSVANSKTLQNSHRRHSNSAFPR